MNRPNFIIVGAQKAGTTALFHMLQQHSQLIGSKTKEIHYFDNDETYSNNSIEYYHSHFINETKDESPKLFFEATPIYLYHPDVPKRLYSYNPNLKIIILLRDPIDRFLSAWAMYHHHFKSGVYKKYHDHRSLSEVIDYELQNKNNPNYFFNKRGYLQRGNYFYQIMDYLKYFEQKDILILPSVQLKNNHERLFHSTFEFLNVKNESIEYQVLNNSLVSVEIDNQNDLDRLQNFYSQPNKNLKRLTGISF
jgi:hypothetical protein